MTKMTILHFASPFAFSMPVVPKETAPVRPGEHTAVGRPEDETVALAGSADPAHGDVSASGEVQAEDEDRLGTSVLDTVLQRYRAHEAGGSASGSSGDDEDRPSPSG